MELHERLRFARQQAHVTQQQLASHLGITRNAISLWEKGETRPEVVRLGSVAEFLNCRLDWLVYEKGPSPEPSWRGPEVKEMERFKKSHPGLAALTEPQTLKVEPGRTVPIYAAEREDGHQFIDFDGPHIEMASPPIEILAVRLAFGVLITEDSMMPVFAPGDIAWIHPYTSASLGGFGLLMSKGHRRHALSGKQQVLIRQIENEFYGPEGQPWGWDTVRLHPRKKAEEYERDEVFSTCCRIVGMRFSR